LQDSKPLSAVLYNVQGLLSPPTEVEEFIDLKLSSVVVCVETGNVMIKKLAGHFQSY
jgi:hypothetical protein